MKRVVEAVKLYVNIQRSNVSSTTTTRLLCPSYIVSLPLFACCGHIERVCSVALSAVRDPRYGLLKWLASHDFCQRRANVDGTATQRAGAAAGAAE
jgi:hypothetical protein